jgi:ribosomal-protein-serine acetyltransferase
MDIELKRSFQLDNEITLRAWRESDIAQAFDVVIRNREHLQEYMHWMTPDYSLETATGFITNSIAKAAERKNLGLGIFRGEGIIGSIGFVEFHWAERKTEIGYWIAKGEEGKGIITRACKLLIDYAFDELNMNRIEIHCSAENWRSAAVPERLGFLKEGVLRQAHLRNGRLHDFAIYGLLAEDRERF